MVQQVVDVLVYVDIIGVYFYGVICVEYYCICLNVGGYNLKVIFSIEQILFFVVILDFDDGMGYCVLIKVIDYVISLVREMGLGFVSVKNMFYCGVFLWFIEQVIIQGMVVIVMM